MAGPPAGRVTRNTIVPYPRPGADGSLPPQSPGSPAVAGPGARPVRSRCRPPFVKQIGSSESTGWRNTHGRTPTSRPFVVSRAWARHRRDAKERFPRCSAGRSVRFNHGASRRWQHATTLHRGHGGASRPDHRARPRRRTRNRTRLCPPDGTGAGWDHRSLCDLAADPGGSSSPSPSRPGPLWRPCGLRCSWRARNRSSPRSSWGPVHPPPSPVRRSAQDQPASGRRPTQGDTPPSATP